MIAGEGLAGVAIAFLVAARTVLAGGRVERAPGPAALRGARLHVPLRARGDGWSGLAVLAALCALLYRAGRRATP